MGRDIVLAKIKKGGITAVVGGAVLMLIFGLITIGVMSDNADDGIKRYRNYFSAMSFLQRKTPKPHITIPRSYINIYYIIIIVRF